MIKPPGSHTDRIAQACDRCRSKKIRCDGKRPHCSQCLAVGFECKTSDKLSRRAFPRGYTESLEDRVRQLESENNKLLNLLDIKDEQMEMLSKVEFASSSPSKSNSASKSQKPPSPPSETSKLSSVLLSNDIPSECSDEKEAYFVHQINTLSPEGTYRGSAAGGVFIDAFLEKLKTKGCTMIPQLEHLFANLDTPFNNDSSYIIPKQSSSQGSPADTPTPCVPNTPASIASPSSPSLSFKKLPPTSDSFFHNLTIPSRLTADKLTATYFHEWNTMYAVLDQYAYLEQYQRVMNDLAMADSNVDYATSALKGNEIFIVIMLLVTSLGSIALKDKSASAVADSWKLEKEWKRLFTPELQTSHGLATVQALVLAEIYSLHTGNQSDVWHYRMMVASMCQRMGLHRCHKSLKLYNGERFSFYDQEMRRRVFWVAYTLDAFSSALLGAPRMLNDRDIECAVPSNIDDEYLRDPDAATIASSNNADKNKSATNAQNKGSSTQMTCPLSVIYFAKVFGNILDTIYSSCKRSHPYKTVVRLEDELESWRRDLPSELKFEFANGMPAPNLGPLHQKSPLLLIMYHYARVLIHMPAISAPSLGANSGTRGSASCVAVMQSSKVVIQVLNYLKARSVIPTLCMNIPRFIVFFGAVVLYGAVDYSRGGALLLEIRKIMSSAVTHLYSDLQLRRPGSLIPESYQIFEEACDTLLNSSNRKGSTDQRRKRTTKKKDTKASATQTQTTTTTNSKTSPIDINTTNKRSLNNSGSTVASLPTPGSSSNSPPLKHSPFSESTSPTPPISIPTPCLIMPTGPNTLGSPESSLSPRSMIPIKQEALTDIDESKAAPESVTVKIEQLFSKIPSPNQLERESIDSIKPLKKVNYNNNTIDNLNNNDILSISPSIKAEDYLDMNLINSLPPPSSTTNNHTSDLNQFQLHSPDCQSVSPFSSSSRQIDSDVDLSWKNEIEHLRNNAINDLLLLNSIVSTPGNGNNNNNNKNTNHSMRNDGILESSNAGNNSNEFDSITCPIDLFFNSSMMNRYATTKF